LRPKDYRGGASFLGYVEKLQQVTVIFPPDIVAARLTYRSTPSRLRLVNRKNSASHHAFNNML